LTAKRRGERRATSRFTPNGWAAETLETIDACRTIRELERAFVRTAPGLIESDGYGICWVDAARRTTSVSSCNVPANLVSEYEVLGRENDALFAYVVAHNRPVHDRVLFGQRQWGRQPVARFLRDWGFERSMQAPLIVGGQLCSTLHFVRNTGANPFAERDLQAARMLQRRVAQQLRVILAERELERAQDMCSALLEHIPVPAVITTPDAELVQANHAAELMLVSYRRRAALWPEYAGAVARNATAIATGADAGVERLAVRADGGDTMYLVRTKRVDRGELFISLFQPRAEEPGDWSLLGARERVVASLVAQGYTNERIASALNLSVNTIKEYLKRINRKLGTTNRAQVAARAQSQIGAR
jgi:DNA-binding CsgD family transcriptional regulator